jgi:hypothetical protein
MNFHPDYISAGFFFGVGCLAITRGLGPCTNVPIIPPEPVRAKQGGPGPRARAEATRSPAIFGAGVKKSKKR